ncbi:MAG: flagellar basal body rod protein FlgB [Emcibacter sp.]|nr:flagellar basal body rod protein FlgB [Emcibacter sp.]
MDLKSISLFSSLSQKMDWLTERQKVLAQNIANANTPGYVPKDLKKISFKAHLDQSNSAGGVRMLATEGGHMSGATDGVASNYEIKVQDADYSMSAPDGNGVNLEDELIKVSETQMDFATAVNLYRKHVSMIKISLGRNG